MCKSDKCNEIRKIENEMLWCNFFGGVYIDIKLTTELIQHFQSQGFKVMPIDDIHRIFWE